MSKDNQNNPLAIVDVKLVRASLFDRYEVFIDNRVVGSLKCFSKGIGKFEVQPGVHAVYVKIKDHKSEVLQLDLKSGEKINLATGTSLLSSHPFVRPFITPRPYLKVRGNLLDFGATLLSKTQNLKQAFKATSDDISSSAGEKSQGHPVVIQLNTKHEKVQAAIEEVRVPAGVTITVKRSRTIEHTLEIDQSVLGHVGISAGLERILGASIRGEIERRQSKHYGQRETIDYEVALSGEINEHFKLVWTDIWCSGLAEFREDNQTRMVPFRLRERTELEVTT